MPIVSYNKGDAGRLDSLMEQAFDSPDNNWLRNDSSCDTESVVNEEEGTYPIGSSGRSARGKGGGFVSSHEGEFVFSSFSAASMVGDKSNFTGDIADRWSGSDNI